MMTAIFLQIVVLLLSLQLQGGISSCPPSKTMVKQLLDDAYTPGIAVIVMNRTNILFEEGIGSVSPLIKPDNRIIHPRKSIFPIGSISKTFIAVAAMQLVESGVLNLDLDLNRYVPNPLRLLHPLHVNHTITMRHVLSHTAGIGPNFEEELTTFSPNDDFLKSNLTKVVFSYLSKTTNWLPEPPGHKVHYSNVGACLAALIIEFITHKSFEEYLHQQILQPLGINRTEASYRLSDFNGRNADLIEHYIYNISWLSTLQSWSPSLNITRFGDQTSNWMHVPPYGTSLYPSGLLRTSAYTLSLFFQSFLNDFPGLLSRSSSVDEMLRIGPNQTEASQFGLIWIWETFSNHRLVGHGGSIPGVNHFMLANENRTLGIILFTNGDVSVPGETSRKIYQAHISLSLLLFDCFQ